MNFLTIFRTLTRLRCIQCENLSCEVVVNLVKIDQIRSPESNVSGLQTQLFSTKENGTNYPVLSSFTATVFLEPGHSFVVAEYF